MTKATHAGGSAVRSRWPPKFPEYRAILDRAGATGPQDVALAGDENAIARGPRDLAAAGVSEFLASPFGTGEEQARTVRLRHELR